MPSHTINKQVFDFTCSSEVMAGTIQKEFIHYIAPQINQCIAAVLSELIPENNTILINEIEIDLGDLSVQEFEGEEMLEKFKTHFREKVAGIKNAMQRSASVGSDSKESFSAVKTDLEITRAFILGGDLPWWADKNEAVDPDVILKNLIQKHTQAIRLFLETQKEKPEAVLRVATQYKPSTKALIRELIPDFFPASLLSSWRGQPSGNTGVTQGHTSVMYAFADDRVMELETFLQGEAILSETNQRQLLIHQLIYKNPSNWLKAAAFFRFLSAEEIEGAAGFLLQSDKVNKQEEQKVIQLLSRLTSFQLRFLYEYAGHNQEFSFGVNGNEQLLSEEQVLKAYTDRETEAISYAAQTNAEQSQRIEVGGLNAEKDLNLPKGFNSLSKISKVLFTDRNNDTAVQKEGDNNLLPPFVKAVMVNDTQAAFIKTLKADDSVDDSPGLPDTTPQFISTGSQHQSLAYQKEAADKIGAIPNQAVPMDQETSTTVNESEAFLTDNKTQASPLFINKEKGQPIPVIVPFFNNSIARVEKINQIQAANIKTSDLNNSSSTEQLPEAEIIKREKTIGFLLESLQNTSVQLVKYLQGLSISELYKLKKKLVWQPENSKTYRKLLTGILEHPYFLKYNLLHLLATISTSGEEQHSKEHPDSKAAEQKKKTFDSLLEKIEAAQAHVQAVLQQLSFKNSVILQDVFQKGRFDSKSEKSLAKRVLLQLPENAVLLMQFLTILPEKEMQSVASSTAVQWMSPKENRSADHDKGVQKYYIENAGLCLIAPYLSGLFGELQYLENRIFKNKFSATRGLFVLQYLATGKRKNPEFLLQLNKLICGFNLEENIALPVRLTPKETAEADNLLEAVIANWKALKNTSIQGFRESFLQRKGILFENDLSWTLQVERLGHDVLLGTIPWNFSMIKLPWMKKMIQVEW